MDSDPERKIGIEWIPSHRDIKGNERADVLAAQIYTTLASLCQRTAKDTTLMRKEWAATRPHGHFAAADRLSPSDTASLSRPIFSLRLKPDMRI